MNSLLFMQEDNANGKNFTMRILYFFSAFLLLLITLAKADERPFVRDNAQAEYLKALKFSGIPFNAAVDDLIEHFKVLGFSNVLDMPLGLKGRNVTLRNLDAMGSSVTIMDVPSTGVRNVTIGLRSVSQGKAWRDMSYSSDLQSIIDTLCDGKLEKNTSQAEAVHCAETTGILYVFANINDETGVKYRLNIMATTDSMLRISYSHN